MPSLLDLDATDLSALLQRREVTAREVTELYLGRLRDLNPEVNAVIEINPRALEIAAALDAGEVRGPLHGVPVIVKDNIDTGDEMRTSAGAWNLENHRAREDAPLVARLRAAGAVILGKATMTEWANFMTVGMPNGFSSRGGQARNPWGAALGQPDLDVGGSSSGSGAAVAARLAPLTVGTETSGSILSPASANGVLGLKPTVGRVSRRGVIPISSSQDTAGPLARSARDAALLLSVLSGEDALDAATHGAPPFEPDFAASPEEALRGVRLGIGRAFFSRVPDEKMRGALEVALGVLRGAGAELVEAADLDTMAELSKQGQEVLIYEFKRDLNAYLAGVEHGPRSLREVIAQNEAEPGRAPYGQILLLAAEATSGTLSEAAYRESRARDLRVAKDALDALVARERLDAWLTPGPWGSGIGAKAGYPSVSVPVATDGAPVGLTFTGPAWSEARLLRLAAAFEARRGGWRAAR